MVGQYIFKTHKYDDLNLPRGVLYCSYSLMLLILMLLMWKHVFELLYLEKYKGKY